jgi:hypothetical protein
MPEAADTGYLRQNTQIYAGRTGFMMVGINNMQNSAAPSIQNGSIFELNGALYKTTGDEGIGGNLSSGMCYVYAVPKTGGASFQYSVTKPAFNTPKGGWYNGNNRAILQFEYASGAYNNKVMMDGFNYDAILEALKKMAGFDIPPDSAARTLVYSKTTEGEASVSLGEGIYEVRMRGAKGGQGGTGGRGSPYNPGKLGGDGLPAYFKCGFFKIASGNRLILISVGGVGNNGDNGSVQKATDASGGSGGSGGGGGWNWGEPGKNGGTGGYTGGGNADYIVGGGGVGGGGGSGGEGLEGSNEDASISYGGDGGDGGIGGRGGSSGDTYYGGGGGGGGVGGGGGSGISETLTLSGGRAPAGDTAAIEIYKVAV